VDSVDCEFEGEGVRGLEEIGLSIAELKAWVVWREGYKGRGEGSMER